VAGKIDPMHQFMIEPIAGSFQGGNPFVFTNSALWLLIVLGAIYVFMLGGMKRALVPGRWQVAVEGFTGFVASMVDTSIGPEGRKYMPWVFTAFIFILFANLMGAMPVGLVKAAHPFTVTSQFTITGVMALISFAIVLGVGFYKHGVHFFSLFWPKNTPLVLAVPISLIELSSQVILHKFNSPAWLKHIQKANAALVGLTPEKMAHLRPGEAFVWSSKATDEAFSKGAIKVRCRPRATQHGGSTKTAVT